MVLLPLPPLLPLLLLLLLAPLCGATAPPAVSDVWPLPALFSRGNESLALAAGFAIACDAASPSPCPDPLPAAFARYAAPGGPLLVGGTPPGGAGGLALLTVSVARAAALAPLDSVADEAYVLVVPGAAAAAAGAPATIAAATQWGALRGLESFAQLVAWGGPDDAEAYRVTCAPARVEDAPRFPVRGVLIDTSFNFLTVPRILDVLDSMAVMKANVLHWHALDDPAWPMQTTSFPGFTAPGSSGPYASVAVYSLEDQARVARYAWERGVAILIEYDVPGHSAAWGANGADSSLVVSCGGGHQTLINPVGEPGEPGTFYDALAQLAGEFGARIGAAGLGGAPLLPWVHLGGDEVTDYTCWLNSSAVQAWARSINVSGSDARALRAAFTERVQRVAAAANLTAMFWEESVSRPGLSAATARSPLTGNGNNPRSRAAPAQHTYANPRAVHGRLWRRARVDRHPLGSRGRGQDGCGGWT